MQIQQHVTYQDWYHYLQLGRESVVGTVICYWLDCPMIKSWWGEIYHTHPNQPWGLLFNGYRVFPRVRRPGVALTNHPHLVPKLKEVWSYTSTPPLSLHGLFKAEIYSNFNYTLFAMTPTVPQYNHSPRQWQCPDNKQATSQ